MACACAGAKWADVDFVTAEAGSRVLLGLFAGRPPPTREHLGIRTTIDKITKLGYNQTCRQVRIWATVSPRTV